MRGFEEKEREEAIQKERLGGLILTTATAAVKPNEDLTLSGASSYDVNEKTCFFDTLLPLTSNVMDCLSANLGYIFEPPSHLLCGRHI